MAHSMDIRRRVIAGTERGESASSIAKRLEISERTVYDYRKRHAADRLEPDKTGPKSSTKLTEADHRKLATTVARRPGVTLRELASMMSKPVVASTVCRALQKLGLTLKKVADRRRAEPHRRDVRAGALCDGATARRCGSVRVPR